MSHVHGPTAGVAATASTVTVAAAKAMAVALPAAVEKLGAGHPKRSNL